VPTGRENPRRNCTHISSGVLQPASLPTGLTFPFHLGSPSAPRFLDTHRNSNRPPAEPLPPHRRCPSSGLPRTPWTKPPPPPLPSRASTPRSKKRTSRSKSRDRSQDRRRSPNPNPSSRHEHAADHGSTAPSRKSDRKPNRSFPDSATLATAMASVAAASAPSFSGGRGSAGAVQKLWSEVDEVALLTGAAAFKDRTGIASRLQGPLGMGGGGWTRVERGRRGLRWTSVGGFSLGRGAVERAVDLESSGGVCDERWWRKDGWTM
jgi:hypothetical protein